MIFSLRPVVYLYGFYGEPMFFFLSFFFLFFLLFHPCLLREERLPSPKPHTNFLPERMIMVFVKDILISYRKVVIYLRLFWLPVAEKRKTFFPYFGECISLSIMVFCEIVFYSGYSTRFDVSGCDTSGGIDVDTVG